MISWGTKMRIKQSRLICFGIILVLMSVGIVAANNVQINHPPEADANGPYEGDLCSPISLDASGSYDPDYPIGSIVSWEWDLDNDGEFDDASGEFVEWIWGSTGDQVVGLRVTDDAGEADISYAQVRVNECEEIPEFPTITLPVVAILGLALFFQRRKN